MSVSVCGRCQAVVKSEAKWCHRCGRFAPALFGARRWLDVAFGSNVAHSRVLLGVIAFFYVVALCLTFGEVDGRGGGGASLTPGLLASVRLGALLPWQWTRSQPWRLVTHCLLHGGVMHIVFNGSSLLVAGPYVEHLFGRARFWIVFVVTGIAGGVAWLGAGTHGYAVGASGALFGFIGIMLAWGMRRGGSDGLMVRNYALRWLAYGAAFSLLPGVAMSAHFGGAVAGFAIGWFFEMPRLRGGRESDLALIGGALAIGLIAICVVTMAVAKLPFAP